jgi:hypothetical protein
MPPDAAVTELLRRPAVVEAVAELGIATLGVEDVLNALSGFGAVRIEVAHDGFTCILEIPGEDPECADGTTVLHAALACWAAALEGTRLYCDRGIAGLERLLTRVDEPQDDAV